MEQNKCILPHHVRYFRKYADDTFYLIDVSANVVDVLFKYSKHGFLIVIDFNGGGKLAGVISRTEINKLTVPVAKDLTANDIVNKNCVKSSLSTIDTDIKKLEKYCFIPVVDDNDVFLYFVHRSSEWYVWSEGQKFELDFWREQFEKREQLEKAQGIQPSKNAVTEENIFKRMHVEDENVLQMIEDKSINGNVLETGAGPYLGYIGGINRAKSRTIIEPLADEYKALRESFGHNTSGYGSFRFYSQGADIFIPELENYADLIISQNSLDHTPDWMFVLGNLSAYAKKDCLFYLWTDLDQHFAQRDLIGHYNITYSPEKFLRFVRNLGWVIIYNDIYTRPIGNTAVSVVARKE